MFGRAGARDAGAQQSYATYILIMTTASGALCPQIKALRRVVLRNPRLRSGYFPARSRPERGVADRGDPYWGEGKRRAERHSCKTQSKTSSGAVSRRPRAPIPATVGQECFTVRQTQRLGLSVRSNARTPTSQWESRQTAALGASTRAPRRARRRSHRRDLISDAAEPH